MGNGDDSPGRPVYEADFTAVRYTFHRDLAILRPDPGAAARASREESLPDEPCVRAPLPGSKRSISLWQE